MLRLSNASSFVDTLVAKKSKLKKCKQLVKDINEKVWVGSLVLSSIGGKLQIESVDLCVPRGNDSSFV